MISAQVNDIGMDVVSKFMRLLRANYPGWERGFFRFVKGPDWCGGNGSCVVKGEVEIISTLKHDSAFEKLNEQAKAYLDGLEMAQGVALFVVDASGEGSIEFERDDLSRWEISMLDGGTGIPSGF